jgi:2-haloacid dehalogenase
VTVRWATFDCYGTLIDWERGIQGTFLDLWPDADAERLLERYHDVEPKVQDETPEASYRDVLAESLRRVAAEEGLQIPAGREGALGDSLPAWPAFPEVPAALQELARRGWHLALLSNTDPDLLDASIEHLGVQPDVTITAADAGSYKPAIGHWDVFFERTGVPTDRHVHVAASLFHDVVPCAELELHCVWINRLGQVTNYPRDAELPDLTELPDALEDVVPEEGPEPDPSAQV